MRSILHKLFMTFRSRLSRRIVFYVFVSVIAIETIILIPSYLKRKQDLLDQVRTVASAQVDVILSITDRDMNDQNFYEQIQRLRGCPNIVGGALYRDDGQKIGIFGEAPELSWASVNTRGILNFRSSGNNRYDSAWLKTDLRRNYTLILRQDTSAVHSELIAYILRITGLVVIISIFVTAGAWIALDPIVVTPILRLRGDLIQAGDAISKDRKTPEFYAASIKRQDELGEVISAFKQMYHQISDAISERKKAEEALQKSFRQVEAYSMALNKELETGRKMQANFLPSELPRRTGWEFSAFFMPARQVSGDFYDAFDLPGNSVGLVIADVCDKGVGAALFMALFRSLIRIFSGQTTLVELECTNAASAFADSNPEADGPALAPAETNALKAIQLTNDYIIQNHEELAMFATLFFGVLEPESGALTYINGGHDPLYILNPSGDVRQQLGPTGPAVGIRPDARLEIHRTCIHPGEILFGYTDGVTEASANDGTFFNEQKLLRQLKTGAFSASQLLEKIATEVKNHIGSAEQFDDITMLAVRRLPAWPV